MTNRFVAAVRWLYRWYVTLDLGLYHITLAALERLKARIDTYTGKEAPRG